MPKVVIKLFREPEEAKQAVSELRAKGYRVEEVGLLMSEKRGAEELAPDIAPVTKSISLPGVGPVTAMGAMAAAITATGTDPGAALVELGGVSEEIANYYQLGISLGGIVVSVHTEEAHTAEARELLRAVATSRSGRNPMWSNSPGFAAASRMSGTNPIDAPMSGDFRRY